MTALRHRAFRRLVAALAASQLGDWIYNVALLAYVYDRSHSATWLGATTSARIVPLVLLGPLGGVLAERLDRRRLMIVADVARAALMVLLATVAALQLPLVVVPVVAALATAAGAAYPACTAASVPRLVARSELASANSTRAAIGPACVVAGPAIGALVVAVGDASTAFALNAIAFTVSALAVASIPGGPAFRRIPRPTRRRLGTDLAGGAAALLAHRPALRLVGADVLASAVYGVLTVALLLVGRHAGLGAAGYGVLLGATGAGAVGGSALATRVDHLPHVVPAALLLVVAPLPLLAICAWLPGLLLLAAVSGVGAGVVEVLTETGLQRELPGAVLARAYGFAFPAAVAGICAGSAVAAPLVSLVGLTPALTLVAAAVAAYALGSGHPPAHGPAARLTSLARRADQVASS